MSEPDPPKPRRSVKPKPSRPKRRRPRKAVAPARVHGYRPPSLNPEQKARKAAYLERFRNFAKLWQGAWYHPQPHDEMCDVLEAQIPEIGKGTRQKKKGFLAPRYTIKTNLAQAFVVYVILFYREQGIDAACAYMRATMEEAEGFLFEIQQRLQSDSEILELWGDLSLEANLWSARRINLGTRRDPSLVVLGLDKGTAGRHVDLVICDDLVNEKNFESVKARRSARTKIQAMYPVMPPWGSLLAVGTRFAHNDLYGWLLEELKKSQRQYDELLRQGKMAEAKAVEPDWSWYIRRVRDAKGNLYAPNLLPESFLAQQKHALEARLYAAWYDNQPQVEGMVRFQTSYLRYFSARYSRWPFPALELISDGSQITTEAFPVRLTMTIDPTTTAGGHSDWTGITVIATDANGVWWVLLAHRYLEVPSRIGEIAVDIIRRYQPAVCQIESASADVDMVSRIQRAIQLDNLPTVITSYHSLRDETRGSPGRPGRRQKAARIEAMEPRFRNGEIYLHRNTCEALYDQYVGWPDIDHDDVFDALAMQYTLAKPCQWSTLKEAEEEVDRRIEEAEEEPLMEYTTTVRDRQGNPVRMGVTLDRGKPEKQRVVGWAGLSTQRLRTG